MRSDELPKFEFFEHLEDFTPARSAIDELKTKIRYNFAERVERKEPMQLWIIYFWIIAVLVVFTALGRIYFFFRTDEVKFYDLVESAISLVAIAGLHGYVYQSAYLSPFLWQIVWILLLVTWLASFRGRKNREMIDKIGVNKGVAVIAATTITGFPTLVGLFAYGFLSNSLWNN